MINILVRKNTFNFNEVVIYLMKAGSLKNSSNSLSSGDQALDVVGVVGKSNGKKKGKRM